MHVFSMSLTIYIYYLQYLEICTTYSTLYPSPFLQDKLESSVVEQASKEARDKATTELIKTLKIAVNTR